jgi:hypothetical protein
MKLTARARRAAISFSPELRSSNPFPLHFNKRYELRDTPRHGGAGSRGLFSVCRQPIKAGVVLGWIRGTIVAPGYEMTYEEWANSAGIVNDDGVVSRLVCTKERGAAWPRFANYPNRREEANCTFVNHNGQVFLCSAAIIHYDDQLLVEYVPDSLD